MAQAPSARTVAYAGAVAATVLALATRELLDPWLDAWLPFVTVFAAVAFAAWHGGTGPGVVAAVLGFVGGAWMFLGEDWLLQPWTARQAGALAGYAFSTAVIIALGAVLHRRRRSPVPPAAADDDEAAEGDRQRAPLALQLARLGTWRYRSAGDLLQADERACEMAGLDPATPAGWTDLLARVHGADRARLEAALARVLAVPQTTIAEELRFVHADGSERRVALRARASADAAEGGVALFGTLQDLGADRRDVRPASPRPSGERVG